MGDASSNGTHGDPSSEVNGSPLHDEVRKRLKWRCRRGMKELDLLLVGYLRDHYADASTDERAVFAQFLELPDPELARYLVWGDVPSDPHQAALCRRILQPH